MKSTKRFLLEGNYKQFLSAYGINIEEALRKAGLSADTLNHRSPMMTAENYFSFMEAVSQQVCDPMMPILMGTAEELKTFSPPIFAAYCSRNGKNCIERLAQYKRLIGPLSFLTAKQDDVYSLEVVAVESSLRVPAFLIELEFIFIVHLIRSASKEPVSPLSVCFKDAIPNEAMTEFFGCTPKCGDRNLLVFSASDLELPFVSWNETMWGYFEPELKRRLAETEMDDSMSARLRSALIELLPGGESDISRAAEKLGISKRTLQRKLNEDGTTFQTQLNHTRELLAKHYLQDDSMTTERIAYLLGYQETNSFLRAFALWTGMSISDYQKYRQEKGEH